MEVWSGSLYVLFGYWFWPLLRWEILLLALSFLLILMAELVNTAIERALERLHPERHELIGLSKDAASAAVFVAILFGFVVVGSVVIHRL